MNLTSFKVAFLFALLFSSTIVHAESLVRYMDRRIDAVAANSQRQAITVAELEALLKSSRMENGCQIHRVTSHATITGSGSSSVDGYDGPILFVQAIGDDGPNANLEATTLRIRDTNLFVLREDGKTTITYSVNVSEPFSWSAVFRAMVSENQSLNRKVVMEFNDGALVFIGETVASRPHSPTAFRCGSAQDLATAARK